MRKALRSLFSGLVWASLGLAALMLCAAGPCAAQGFATSLGSVDPLGTLESVIGPIFPQGGIGSSFRSELGTGFRAAALQSAKLTGGIEGPRNLLLVSYIDRFPRRFDFYANVRLWRFGLRGGYTHFENLSRATHFSRIELSGVTVGGDVDVVQFPWLALGASADFFLYEPTFRGRLTDSLVAPSFTVKGDRPVTVGPYLRYVPPDILGFPLHIEAAWKIPVRGAKYTSYSLSLVFRPQIYRFDVAARFIVERSFLKFKDDRQITWDATLPQTWELDLEWQNFGMEFVAYF